MRRIVTAREQVEMLSPWRTAAEDEKDTRICEHQGSSNWPDYCVGCRRAKSEHTAAKPSKLYRGVRVNLPPELVAEMKEKLASPRSAEEAGRELDLGPKILDHLASNPWEATLGGGLHDWTGLGPHWHTDPRFAHTAAYGDLDERQQGLGKRDFPFLMTAEWDGQGQVDAFGGDGIENETQVGQGTPLNITSLVYHPELHPDGSAVKQYSPMGGNTSIELLHNPIYDRHGIHSGGPRQYTAFKCTAERADDFRWERSFDGPGGWILVTRTPDGNPVTVKTEPTRGQRSAALDKTLEQHLRDTYEPHPPGDPGLPESLVPHLMLPTDIAHHYREYDRPVDDENTAMLTRVIADQGIRQPLKISTDGTHAILHEGNHRVTVARQLGISHVPVQVHLEKPGEVMTNSATSRPVPLEPVLGEWVNHNRQNLKSFWS